MHAIDAGLFGDGYGFEVDRFFALVILDKKVGGDDEYPLFNELPEMFGY